ncbi:MAG: cation transporter [Deltaproteobacteria bacterium]|nr:cation transporter [Deltaproteobacteria bacterium]
METTGPAALTRFAWLSIAAAVLTIALKALAYLLTGSVGLLSDALESVVNLVAAVVTLAMLTLAAQPPDDEHPHGHTKAEYFASGLEGGLIMIAAGAIVWASIPRLFHPKPIEQISLGLGVSVLASVVNFATARTLLSAGKRHHSIALEADAHHLMTDVLTSAGVLVGLGLAVTTGWLIFDPIVALLVAANIVWTGAKLMHRSAHGLLDVALAAEDLTALDRVLKSYTTETIQFHAVRTRQAGSRKFVSMHVLVPGEWTVRRGHDLLEQVERDIRQAIPQVTVLTHLEAVEDPASWQDVGLDRDPPQSP